MRSAWFLAFAVPACAGLYILIWFDHLGTFYGAVALAAAAVFACMGAMHIGALARRKRPILDVLPESLEFGSIYPFARRTSLPLRDVAAVHLVGPSLVVRKKSGESLAIHLDWLSEDSRLEALRAVEERIRE